MAFTAPLAPSLAPRRGRGSLSASASLQVALLALMGAVAHASNGFDSSRGWLVDAKTKEDAHMHTRRVMLQHEEQGHELMAAWWADWKGYFARRYESKEAEDKAFAAFQRNMRMVHEINTSPHLTFWASGNQFSDLTWEEFKFQHLQHVPFNGSMLRDHPGGASGVDVHEEADDLDSPSSTGRTSQAQLHDQQQRGVGVVAGVGASRRRLQANTWDWRDKGINTPVRNQGSCDSCWVMAGVHALEASYMIYEGWTKPVQLSAQQALDCYNVGTCMWGNAAEMMYQATLQPLTTEDKYPLFSDKTGQTGPCRNDLLNSLPSGNTVELSGGMGYERLEMAGEDKLTAKTTVNPVIMHFEVDVQFMQYSGGVYTAQTCSGNNLNHALVAWGFDRGAGWWLFKNSWSDKWGEQGYVRVAMVGGSGTCGLYKWAFKPGKSFSRRLNANGRKSRKPKTARRLAADSVLADSLLV